MLLQLVIAPSAPEFMANLRYACFPPLDLLSLATYVRNTVPEWEVEILDGQILGLDSILSSLRGDAVGISPRISNYTECLEIARKAESVGARVLMGGAYASELAILILRDRPYVEAVISGDGEEALARWLQGESPQTIPNLAWRAPDGQVIRNHVSWPSLDGLPPVDNTLVVLQPYAENFRRRYPHLGNGPAISTCAQKGCLWRAKTGGCVFCGRMYPGFRVRPPRVVWEEITRAAHEQNVDFVWDVSDSLTCDVTWLRDLVKSRPQRINPGFMVLGRANEITDEVADLLFRLNCRRVLVGVESGSREMLAACNKGTTPEQNLEAAKRLAERRIELFPSFVIGLPGESEETLRQTYEHACRLFEIGLVREVQALPLIPITGSKAFRESVGSPEIDIFSVDALRHNWYQRYTNAEYELVWETARRISAIANPSRPDGE